MGAGKTSVGEALTARTGHPLRDTDADIVAADEPEIERAVGELVHLPADADGQHLHCAGRENAREPEFEEWRVAADPRVGCVC